ncbi:MAG: heme exporter protein CcmB [Longimicrobiales bacterium]
MNAEMHRVFAIAWKDVTAERRSKANFNAVAFFAGLMLIMFGMAIGPDNAALASVSAGVLWLAILLSGVLSFNRSYEREIEAGALDALLLYPGDRRSIFIGKFLANLLFVVLVEVIIVPMAAILFKMSIAPIFLPLAGILFLGTVGFVALGTFYAAMSSRLRAREVLLPLLLFPMLIPLLLASVRATAALLDPSLAGEAAEWAKILVIFDVIFLAATFVAFEHVIEG